MNKVFRAWDVDQVWLLPAWLHQFVPPGDLAHFVQDTVREALELSAITGVHKSEQGQPPFHPGLLVALLFYGYRGAELFFTAIGACLGGAGGHDGGDWAEQA